jgi:endonuclease/exonuclease/phosphatase (EEP) superfamily protein YafD
VSCVATLTSFLGRIWQPFELTTHFPVQYLVTLLTAAIVFAILRRFGPASVFLLFALPNLLSIVPFYVAPSPPARLGAQLKVVLMNVSVTNTEFDKASTFVRSCNPDLVVVEELDQNWLDNLRRRLPNYNWWVARPRYDEFGIALFSKTPLEDAEIIHLAALGFPSIRSRMWLGPKRLAIFAVHAPPPIAKLFYEERVRMMKDLAGLTAKEDAAVVLGDLNTTPWSSIFHDLLDAGGLRDGRIGFGVRPTWPANFPWLLIPIDHCLVSQELVVTRFDAGPNIGSDHYPLIVEFGVLQPQ